MLLALSDDFLYVISVIEFPLSGLGTRFTGNQDCPFPHTVQMNKEQCICIILPVYFAIHHVQ